MNPGREFRLTTEASRRASARVRSGVIKLGIDATAPLHFAPALHIELQCEHGARRHVVDGAIFRKSLGEFGDTRVMTDDKDVFVFDGLLFDDREHYLR